MSRKILVTSALPYANGHIHLGHLVEYLQTDIWVRFQKLRGNHCVYMCADDTHGTAIMIRARQEGRTEAEVIADMAAAHQRDFAGFQVAFDHYGSTNSESNRQVCHEIWAALRREGLVLGRDVEQLYDVQAGTFLADRFVKGTCPKCGAADQYGDSCEKCGATYSPAELKDPVSTLSGTRPELRSAHHLFVDVEQHHAFLAQWTQSGSLQPEIANYLHGHFLAEPLRPWDVSRPAPYFGFEIPDAPGHYWYVWFDAPIGYIGATREWCERVGEDFASWWRSPDTEIHHFIGKDITYFHTLFWPAELKTAGFNLPRKIHIHGFLTVDGEKMSKSRGTFVLASTYLQHLDPAYLRYYYASKLTPKVDDLDLNLEDFSARVNADLVGKVVNLASRSARFVSKTGLSSAYPEDGGLFANAAKAAAEVADAYEEGDFAKAMRLIMALADRANEYVDRQQPWTLKDPSQAARLQDVSTVILNLFRQLVVMLSPVLPRLAEQTETLLGRPLRSWGEVQQQLLGTPVAPFEHMMQRVDPKRIEAMVAASAEDLGAGAAASTVAKGKGTEGAAAKGKGSKAVDKGKAAGPAEPEPQAAECTVDDLGRVDLRIAKILQAEAVPEAKKLLKLTVDLGHLGQRTIFAGIKGAYEPETLVGRLVVVVANLAPRQMKFGLSEGMVLACGDGGAELFLCSPDEGAKPGQRLH